MFPDICIFCQSSQDNALFQAMLQVTSSLVVTPDKINSCSVYTEQADLCAVRVSVAPHTYNQLKDADVMSLPHNDLEHTFNHLHVLKM